MWSRLAFFGLAFVAIVAFAISLGDNLNETGRPAYVLGLSGKLAQGCEPPPSGCPADKYWDPQDCQCRSESSGNNCEEPEGGCGEDHYWDEGNCVCIYNGPTIPPSESPEPTESEGAGGCSEPSGGCGSGHYWDSYSCSCKSESYCSPPSTGCGTDKYWDSYSCECKDSCYEPAGGCGNDKYWDYGDCSCRSYNSCSPPGGGCGVDFYWDYYYCSCKPYEGSQQTGSCTSPAAGCGDNYYWDSYSCNCKQYPTNYSCEDPSGGCGIGWYWDSNSCACYSESDDNIYYTSYDSPYAYEQEYDRLAYESSEIINCVRSILTPTEYDRLRYLVPSNQTEEDELHQLGNRVESCWEQRDDFSDQAFYDESGATKSPLAAEACLKDALGGGNFQEIYSGEREPTYEEHLLFEVCFGNVSIDTINYITNDQELPPPVDSCLLSVLGQDLYEDISVRGVDVPFEFRDKVDRCFGVDPQPFDQGQTYSVPSEIESCLESAVGKDRFDEINSGRSEPTDAERARGDACFGRLHEDQVKFLLPPPAQVPYLPPDPGLIGVVGITQDTREIDGKSVGGSVLLSGKGPPNSTVSIYIYSEPIVVTTKTDENGDWVYELNQPLEGEQHVAYATVRNESGDVVRSSVFNFTVSAAEPGVGLLLEEEGSASEATTRFLVYALGLSAVIILIVGGSAAFVYMRKGTPHEAKKEELTGDRDSKGDTGPGSVN